MLSARIAATSRGARGAGGTENNGALPYGQYERDSFQLSPNNGASFAFLLARSSTSNRRASVFRIL